MHWPSSCGRQGDVPPWSRVWPAAPNVTSFRLYLSPELSHLRSCPSWASHMWWLRWRYKCEAILVPCRMILMGNTCSRSPCPNSQALSSLHDGMTVHPASSSLLSQMSDPHDGWSLSLSLCLLPLLSPLHFMGTSPYLPSLIHPGSDSWRTWTDTGSNCPKQRHGGSSGWCFLLCIRILFHTAHL